ncbi:hypothetical protein [Oryzomonas rubra]|uniref:Uncharacterized protein n=1 Tax=Oryzomonas rubra TaxID=2509454 RepID=A0A5A9XSD7_9BACT|nr:hypothetical protein [Oryzomonas rubra]KAA0895465.1 hypothetical protein ET418_02795 [Oryzomonas rubra]
MIIPDQFARSVRLQVKIVNGQVMQADGQPLPKMKNESRGELVLYSVFSLEDEKDRVFHTTEHVAPFLNTGNLLWARVNNDPIEKELEKFRIGRRTAKGESHQFVQFALETELFLILRPGKNAVLTGCNCSIPALGDNAASVNEAYTKISTVFEPKRRSHTGNVFQCVYIEQNDMLIPLETMRMRIETQPIPQEEMKGSVV